MSSNGIVGLTSLFNGNNLDNKKNIEDETTTT